MNKFKKNKQKFKIFKHKKKEKPSIESLIAACDNVSKSASECSRKGIYIISARILDKKRRYSHFWGFSFIRRNQERITKT